jgi:hypothetical protein
MGKVTEQFRICITKHGLERFAERRNRNYSHLWSCCQENCLHCQRLRQTIRQEIARNRKTIEEDLRKCIDDAEEIKWYINDSRFMERHYERYGYNNHIKFLHYDKFLFVVSTQRRRRVLITVMWSKSHTIGRIYNRPKYKKSSEQIC